MFEVDVYSMLSGINISLPFCMHLSPEGFFAFAFAVAFTFTSLGGVGYVCRTVFLVVGGGLV